MKQLIIKIIAIPMVVATMLSCNNTTNLPDISIQVLNANNTEVIDCNDIIRDVLNNRSLYIEDIIDTISIIKLETKEESVFEPIKKFIATSKNIYILDIGRNVLIFKRDGSFVKKLQRGQGPGEIIIPEMIAYNEKNDQFVVFQAQQANIYTGEGEYKSSVPLPPFTDVIGCNDGWITFQIPLQSPTHKAIITPYEEDFSLKNFFTLPQELPTLVSPVSLSKTPDNNSVYAVRTFDNNIYYATKDSVFIKYKIDLSKYTMEIEETEGNFAFEKYSDISDKFYFDGNFFENSKYQVFSIGNVKNWCLCFRNKKSGKIRAGYTTNCKTEKNNGANIVIYSSIQCIIDDYFCLSYEPVQKYIDELKEIKESDIISKEDLSIMQNLTEDDNPVIVLYKLKGLD